VPPTLNKEGQESNMIANQELANLAKKVVTLSGDFHTELVTFPSGAAMLDVRYRGRLFVIAYSPGGGYGVDEVDEEVVGIGTWFRNNYDDFTDAKEKLLTLLMAAMGKQP
jgi:hypothetical protein